MVRALDPSGVFDFEVADGDAVPTVFEIRVLTVREREWIMERYGKAGDEKQTRIILDTIRLGLNGWRDFLTATDDEVEFEMADGKMPSSKRTEFVSDAALQLIPPKIWGARCHALLMGSLLTEEDKKN